MRTKDRNRELFFINVKSVRTEDQRLLDEFIDDFTTRYSEFLSAGIDLRDEFNAEWDMVLKGKEPFRMLTTYYTLDKERPVQIINRCNNKAVVHIFDLGDCYNDDAVEMVDVYEDEKGEHIKILGDYVTSYGYPEGYYADDDDIDYLYPDEDNEDGEDDE